MHYRVKISILATLFLFQEVNAKHDLCHSMVFSDALPVQFWLTECNTFNQQVSDGVHHRCFCQPWQCDDEIKIQFKDGVGGEDFGLQTFENQTVSGDVDWTLGATPTVSLPNTLPSTATAEDMYEPFTTIPGATYEIEINYTTSGVSVSNVRAGFLNDSFGTEVSDLNPEFATGTHTATLSVVATANSTYLFFRAINNQNGTLDVTLNSLSIAQVSDFDQFSLSVRDESGNELLSLPFDYIDNGETYVYSLTVIPSETSPEICDQLIQFVIINETTGTARAQSDCQDIRTNQPNTILSNYRNHRNIFGLVYEDQSPDIDFNLRIPAIFYHQRFPEVEETMELSDSLVSLNSTIRRQRLLNVDYVPYYFHEKIQLMLMHQFVTIINKEWVKQEGYEIELGNKKSPLKMASIFLSEKEFVQRNVL